MDLGLNLRQKRYEERRARNDPYAGAGVLDYAFAPFNALEHFGTLFAGNTVLPAIGAVAHGFGSRSAITDYRFDNAPRPDWSDKGIAGILGFGPRSGLSKADGTPVVRDTGHGSAYSSLLCQRASERSYRSLSGSLAGKAALTLVDMAVPVLVLAAVLRLIRDWRHKRARLRASGVGGDYEWVKKYSLPDGMEEKMNDENDVRQGRQSMEQSIRAKQLFEEHVKKFLKLASAMTDNELEIALARIADIVDQGKPEAAAAAGFRGMILHVYYRMRFSGTKRHSKLARAKRWFRPPTHQNLAEYLISTTASYAFPPIPAEHAPEYCDDDALRKRVESLAPR